MSSRARNGTYNSHRAAPNPSPPRIVVAGHGGVKLIRYTLPSMSALQDSMIVECVLTPQR
jgi:hypothetical protein